LRRQDEQRDNFWTVEQGADLHNKLDTTSISNVTTWNLTDNLTTGITGNLATRTLAATGHVLLGQNTIQAGATQAIDVAFVAKVSGAAWTLAQCQQALTNIRATLGNVGITV